MGLENFENLWCGLYTNQRHFIHNLNQEVHNILETKFHKNFTSKKKSCTKYSSSSQIFPKGLCSFLP